MDTEFDLGGEDTVRIGLLVDWGDDWQALQYRLDQAKTAAQAENRAVLLLSGGYRYLVEPVGVSLASGAGPFMRWLIRDGGMAISIAKTAAPKGALPNVWVDLGSLALIEWGGFQDDGLWSDIRQRIRALGGTIQRAILSRVDPCLDLVGVAVSTFTQLFRDRDYISRARKGREFEASVYRDGRHDTGFTLGASGIRIRVYDKIAECKKDPLKFAALQTFRWCDADGKPRLPEAATRVEFQVRREELKTLGVDTVDDWFEKRASVVRYLCEKWVRFTLPHDERHTNRAVVHPLWNRVLESFVNWAAGEAVEIERSFVKNIDPKPLLEQAIGCLTTAAVLSGVDFEEAWRLDRWASHQVGKVLSDYRKADWLSAIRRKKMELAARLPKKVSDHGR